MKRFLIMDNDVGVRTTLAEMVLHLGLDASFVASGEQAIQCYRHAYKIGMPYDVVILDLNVLYGLGGIKTLHHLKRIEPAVKAILTSGVMAEDLNFIGHEHGFASVLPKPFTIDTFSKAIEKASDEMPLVSSWAAV